MGGTQEPPDGEPREAQERPTPPEWETTEFPAVNFDGYPPAPDQGQYPAGQPEYGYGGYDPNAYGADPYSQGSAGYGGEPGGYAGGPGQYGGGPAGYGSDPGGYAPGTPMPGWPAPPPPARRSRTLLIAVIAVVVLAGAGVGAYFAFSGSDSGSKSAGPTGSSPSTGSSSASGGGGGGGGGTDGGTVAAPSSFAGYTQLNNAAAQAAKNAISGIASGSGGGSADLLKAATVTVYGPSGTETPSLITFAVPTSQVPGDPSPDEFTKSFLSGVATNVQTVDAGSHGGSARCTQAQFGTASETLCAWADSTTSGGIVSVLPALPISQLTTVENSFRDAVD